MTAVLSPEPALRDGHRQLDRANGHHDAIEQLRRELIDAIVAIVEGHYESRAKSISIADVKHFANAEGCRSNIEGLSLEHLQYVHGMVTGNRIPRPKSLDAKNA
ncbi:MAG: hypothetical protein Q7R81_04525 [Candidatus Peregrinibacteria bacterium]|nr:hypothetical protein [Candidatus Peregrinibacteria bacterium]